MLHPAPKNARQTASAESVRINIPDGRREVFCMQCELRNPLYPRLNVGSWLYDPRDDELTSWIWRVRAHPTLKWGYKGVQDTSCRTHSAYDSYVVCLSLLQWRTLAITSYAYHTDTVCVTCYADYFPHPPAPILTVEGATAEMPQTQPHNKGVTRPRTLPSAMFHKIAFQSNRIWSRREHSDGPSFHECKCWCRSQ